MIFDHFVSPDPADQEDKFVDAQDLVDFVSEQLVDYELEVEPYQYGLYQLMKIFDYNADGFLDFDDFLLILLPQDNIELHDLLKEKAEFERDMVYDNIDQTDELKDIVRDLAYLLHIELTFLRRIEDAKDVLERTDDYSSVALFKHIDQTNKNFIDPVSLKAFARGLGFEMSDNAIKAIYRRTNSKFNFKITFQEFVQNICHPIRPDTFNLVSSKVIHDIPDPCSAFE